MARELKEVVSHPFEFSYTSVAMVLWAHTLQAALTFLFLLLLLALVHLINNTLYDLH